MTIGGWIFLTVGWGFVTVLIIYCYQKILKTKS